MALSAYSRHSDTSIEIYYDGDPQIEHPDRQRRVGMDIFFSRRPQKADDLIMRALEQRHGARWLRVVTSDREIQRFAARHKIAFTSAQVFADEMETPLNTRPHYKSIEAEFDPHWTPDDNEVDELERAFQQQPRSELPPPIRTRESDPNVVLKKSEVDEWEKLFEKKTKTD